MIYFSENSVVVRAMRENDIAKFVQAFAEQSWHKPATLFDNYLKRQSIGELKAIVAEIDEQVAGYVLLIPQALTGPFASIGIPEVVDLNVLIKFQRHGLGNKLMDVAEQLASDQTDAISLAVGLHSGYGAAQRMYVKRGFTPDGSGVWYKGEPLDQYALCENNDDLILYMYKKL